GRQPFKGRNRIELLHAVINEEAEPITEYNPKAPDELQTIVDRAMAKRPRDRFGTMAELRDALKNLLRGLSVEMGVPPVGSGMIGVAPRRARNSWRLTGALGRVFGKRRNAQPARNVSQEPTTTPSQSPSKSNSDSNSGISTSRPPSW